MNNSLLTEAKVRKADEFYTQLVDIEKEMCHYKTHFNDKIVYCNTDDYRLSNFWKYFYDRFQELGLKKLISTCFSNGGRGVKAEYDGVNVVESELAGDGDFRSQECIDVLNAVDIVVTNPPFSLFREYIKQLFDYDKKFIILGNQNGLKTRVVFPKMRDNEVWFGASIHSGDREFLVPDDYIVTTQYYRIGDDGKKYIRVTGVRWFTNLEYEGRYKRLELKERFSPEKYPKYDNYDAVDVSKTKLIPFDYDGVMGVPVTFMDKYSPDQFEIVGISGECGQREGIVNGVSKYVRIFIKNKNVQ